MKYRLLILVSFFVSMRAMQKEDVSASAAQKSKQRAMYEYLLKENKRIVTYPYIKDGKTAIGETSRIYCPARNHKIIIPQNSSFAIIFPNGQWTSTIRNPRVVKHIACTYYTEPDDIYYAIVFETLGTKDWSPITFNDVENPDSFDVTIIVD